jgi:transcriptional regulator with XRE-family HTH domain
VAVQNDFDTTRGCVRTIGERLAWFRKSSDLNLAQLSALTGISRSELSRLENGGRVLKPEHCTLLSAVYGMTSTAFEDALHFDPLLQIVQSPAPTEAAIFERRRTIPCYGAATYPDRGSANPTVTLTVDVPLSADAYAIRIDTRIDAFLPVDGLVLADPAARTMLGDLVINTVDRRGLLISLHRDSNGALAGRTADGVLVFPKQIRVINFHKVVALFPAPHLVA